jgi:lipopolysaccharide transport system permease protein
MNPHRAPLGDGADPSLVVHGASRPRLSWAEHGPQRILGSFTENADLIMQLTRREIAARYRGSALGVAWSFVTPILMLAIYTFVFSVVFQTRWAVTLNSRFEFALVLFAGLIVYTLFAECIGRAPALMFENPSYIKRIVFPVEALAWVSVLNALFNAAIAFAILLAAYLFTVGVPPATAVLLPLVIAPLVLLILGSVWFLAATGVYLRDVRQLVGVILPVLMFASPLFYPISALPERFRGYMKLNPLATAMEQVRGIVLFGHLPDWTWLAISLALSLVVAWGGLVWFLVTKRGFADVV